MSTLVLGRICRTCLLESSTMHKLLDIKRDHLHIEEMLRKTVPNFDLSMYAEVMPLPVEICDDCWEKLQLSYDFHQLCMSSNKRLKHFLKNSAKENALPSSADLGYKDQPNEIGQQKDSSESVQECSLLKCGEKDNSLPSSVDLGCNDLPNEIGQQRDSSESIQDLQEDIKMEIGEELVTAVQLKDCILKKEETIDLEFLSDAESVKEYDDRDIHYKIYECKMCYKSFSIRPAFDEHRRTHTEELPYLCPICGKSFKTNNSRWNHLQIHGEKNWQCPECPMRFNLEFRLRRHMRSHSKERPFVCDICGAFFKRSDNLNTHKLRHGQKRFKCKECNLSFVYERSLVHHKRSHTGEKPHTCTQCNRSYVFKGNLIRHLHTHLDKNTYFCDECPETFKYGHELRVHKHQHYNEKSTVASSGEETLEIA